MNSAFKRDFPDAWRKLRSLNGMLDILNVYSPSLRDTVIESINDLPPG